MGRASGSKRRVVPFPGRRTCDERRALKGFMEFGCRTRSELAYELLDLLEKKPPLPTKLRAAVAVDIFSLFVQQMEDVCQWLIALRDLPSTESIFDAVKNTSLNDRERSQLVKWLTNATDVTFLRKLTGTQSWSKNDLSCAGTFRPILASGLDEFLKPKTGLRQAFPMHILEALKHGNVAVYGLVPRSRMVTVLTQGAGLADIGGNDAIFHITCESGKIRPDVDRMDAVGRAFTWVIGAVYKARFGNWPRSTPRFR